MKIGSNNIGIIFCPPLAEYPTPPCNMSQCELIDCPECNKKMWLSAKKKIVKQTLEIIDNKVIITCYPCFIKLFQKMNYEGTINSPTDFITLDLTENKL